jgi:Fic family protein
MVIVMPISSNQLGYAWLIEHFSFSHQYLDVVCSSAKISSVNKENSVYPVSYRPTIDTVVDHLTFAIKYESINLYCLTAVFWQKNVKPEIELALNTNPTSKYNRLIGFYFELLTNQMLNAPDLSSGNYVDAVDAKQYYVAPSQRERKFRINNNLVGNGRLSALMKRNESLIGNEELCELARKPLTHHSMELLARAARYLIALETKSSNEIEAETITPSKQIKFMFALESINQDDLTKEKLITTLNIIKDKHYQELDYRYQQNYLGKSGRGYASVDYVPPKFNDAHDLMDNWFILRGCVLSSDMPAIAKAAALSSSFVYIHPFMDGNGRLSRYIMQDTLYRDKVIDQQYALPLSSGILKDISEYYRILSQTSGKIMKSVQFELLDNYSVAVLNDTADLYRHLCFDAHAQYLSDVSRKVAVELIPEELEKLQQFDRLMDHLNGSLDLQEKDLGLIANLLISNEGKISIKKRKGTLQHIHVDDLNSAEYIYDDLFL